LPGGQYPGRQYPYQSEVLQQQPDATEARLQEPLWATAAILGEQASAHSMHSQRHRSGRHAGRKAAIAGAGSKAPGGPCQVCLL
jgi:hypothetical protein